MSRLVIALGGNALGNTAQQQIEKVREAAKAIVDLIVEGHDVVVTHGNGPQVGMINLAFEKGEQGGFTPGMPLQECTAMSQGYIGYHLQQAIDAELVSRGHNDTPVVTMVTQVVVDASDPAFQKPTKPIGSYYDEATAKKIMGETGQFFGEDAGRGWRRMVASPLPVDIYEKASIRHLLAGKQVLICCGGGGVPVVQKDGHYEGVAAVIDKDFAAAKLAELVEADFLFILTAVDQVAIRYGKPDVQWLSQMTVADAQRYCDEGHFAPGSMLPKVQAAMRFAATGKGRKAVIGSLEKAKLALSGKSGTVISDRG